ncbi:MAG: nuclear transport factor 2 family protein [Rhodobiaceae bacterium]|nr:nuclear transport factor 2 family protein [Rhodobiaceae bacterium]
MTSSPPRDHPFIQEFREIWANPTLDDLMAPLREDVTLIQPLSKPLQGKQAARKAFRKILTRFPGLQGDVHGGLGNDDLVFIDWTMVVPIGRGEQRLPVIDKVTLIDGRVKERIAYFDPSPLFGPIARSPRTLARHALSALR